MRIALAALVLAVAGCSNQPDRPGQFTTPAGDGWMITYVSSAISGSTHIYINGQRAASGSFGVLIGNKASGAGKFKGKRISFHCVNRFAPDCTVYADGHLVADIKYQAQH